MPKKIIVADVAVLLLLNQRRELLLQKKDEGYTWSPGKWCFFGGHIEQGEKPSDAARREAREELSNGVRVPKIQFFVKNPYEVTDGSRIKRGVQHAFYGDFLGKPSDIRLGEGAGFAFFSRQETDRYKPEIARQDFGLITKFWDFIFGQE